MSSEKASASNIILSGVPEGLDALALAGAVNQAATEDAGAGLHIHVARDDRRLDQISRTMAFFAPDIRVVAVPAWDTVPYDRVSPAGDIVAKRMMALARLSMGQRKVPTLVLTTVNAILQRVPPRAKLRSSIKQMAPGQRIDIARLTRRLQLAGFTRTGTVMEPGEFAVRGGIIDLFPAGRTNPVRLDFFGDTLETIKIFDVETQRTSKTIQKVVLIPITEMAFGDEAIARFRSRYVELFGGALTDDLLYEAVSSGARYPGQEHWLPLFHEQLETLLDYAPGADISFDHLCEDAISERMDQITEHYEARVDALEIANFGAAPYKPVPPDEMFLDKKAWREGLKDRKSYSFTPFEEPSSATVRSFEGREGRTFSKERTSTDINVFDAVVAHIARLHSEHRRVVIAAWTTGARERLAGLLNDHGLKETRTIKTYHEALELPANVTGLAVLGLERGFEAPDVVVIGEQDILGDRLVRTRRKRKRDADVLTEATSLSPGDFVVHADHGIGRFVGLETITALDSMHDCLQLTYAGGDKLFLPVENIELLTRYGGNDANAQLDKLGGGAWQARKSKLKKKLLEIAAELIKIAAMRELREAPILVPPPGAYEEFVAGFPFDETEDQATSIEQVLADLASGRPMDRLVCGDVGFGKTEVALRAAFVTALAGLQVALVVPTTLLARQHFASFKERFNGLPVRVAQASRLVGTKELNIVKEDLKSGDIDIVIGTHALLGKSITFKRLGLVIIDEEQHFGVAHKERLKAMREDVHVLTLSATPIPRTMQLALTGVRELSLITTPPVDRLAVRTYISPFDPVVLRDALRRERYRGGQTFYVVPHLADLDGVTTFLTETVPELRIARAHGQLPPTQLEDVMTAFYEGRYDVLLSTPIVESGLDVPNANTLIIHRAHMFGLAQLYQLRGRVGRSKTRAYAYFTLPPGKTLTQTAQKRLKVLHSLDSLGAGFSLASHDLDIRGAGNLLGEEQSGHIKEVGFELYQAMLEEAVATMKGGSESTTDQWSPEIQLGTSIMIPDTYVEDLQTRLGLYRRLSDVEDRSDIDSFAAELVDRFGTFPQEVKHLLDVMEIKGFCRTAGIARVDAGPKGAVLTLKQGTFNYPKELVAFIESSRGRIKAQPDQKVVCKADWDGPDERLKGVRGLVSQFAQLATKAQKSTKAKDQ